LLADGRGIFQGKGAGPFTDETTTTAIGSYPFQVSPETFAEVVRDLAPIRPSGRRIIEPLQPGECADYLPDAPSRNLAWSTSDGKVDALHWDTGCSDPSYAAIKPAINAALAKLPVLRLIGGTPIPK
jgi:hypothetical protein